MREFHDDFHGFLESIAKSNISQVKNKMNFLCDKLDINNVSLISDRLRPKNQIDGYSQLDFVGQEIERATNEQSKILADIKQNDQFLINGSAGTGKTIMAIECYKKSLKNKINKLLKIE